MIAMGWSILGLIMAMQAGFYLPAMAANDATGSLPEYAEPNESPTTIICSSADKFIGLGEQIEQLFACQFLYLNNLSEANRQLFLSELEQIEAPAEFAALAELEVKPKPPEAKRQYVVPASVEHWSGLVSQYFDPADVAHALSVIDCESIGGDPNAVNPSSSASGLFQHLPKFWAERSAQAGWSGADIFDPEANVAVAAWLAYNTKQGWGHWPNCG